MTTPADLNFIAPGRLSESWDVSRSFLWKLEQAGLLEPLYLYSRKLYRVGDVRRLEAMIERGELKAALRGAARKRNDRARGSRSSPASHTTDTQVDGPVPPRPSSIDPHR